MSILNIIYTLSFTIFVVGKVFLEEGFSRSFFYLVLGIAFKDTNY